MAMYVHVSSLIKEPFHVCYDDLISYMNVSAEILSFSSVLYECVTQETPEMLPAYIAMDQVWFKKPIPILMRFILYFT